MILGKVIHKVIKIISPSKTKNQINGSIKKKSMAKIKIKTTSAIKLKIKREIGFFTSRLFIETRIVILESSMLSF